jgi:hypothetical protein
MSERKINRRAWRRRGGRRFSDKVLSRLQVLLWTSYEQHDRSWK